MSKFKIHPSHWVSAEPWSAPFELPRFQSHRGFHLQGLVENTLEAFRASKKQGFRMIECDVQLSADRVPVIYHDRDLKRLYGDSRKVKDLSLAELKVVASITTLKELLLDPYVPEFINIEIKTDDVLEEDLERRVSDVVSECKAESKIIFSSFNPFSLWKLQGFIPQTPRALLVGSENDGIRNFVLNNMLLAPFLKIHCLNLEMSLVTADTMRRWNQKGVPVAVWTVKDKKEIPQLFSWGIKSIITDLGSEVLN